MTHDIENHIYIDIRLEMFVKTYFSAFLKIFAMENLFAGERSN